MTRARASAALPAVLALLAVAALALLSWQRRPWEILVGDEPTYLAMAESLAYDGDLAFTEADVARLELAQPAGRDTVILQRAPWGVTYSKPLPYALLAAPFVRVAGAGGFFLLNALLLAAALALALAFLRRLAGPPGGAALTLATFAGTGVLAPHVGWRMSDLMLAALALSGLVLAVAVLRQPGIDRGSAERGPLDRLLDGPAAPLLAGLCLGLAAVLRVPNALLAAAAGGALVVGGLWRRALVVWVAAAAVFLGAGVLQKQVQGAASPYRAERATFNREIGYPVGDEAPRALLEFEERVKRARIFLLPEPRPAMTVTSALYFVAGRHTGLVLYFPAALLFAVLVVRRGDRVSWVLAAAAAGVAAFYLVWLPDNYFGGSSFLGNRYFLAAYPVLLVALPRLPGRGPQLAVWTVAALAAASAAVSVPAAAGFRSQSHAHAGIFRLLPYESTARAIEGRDDHYWADELVRFVDPYAEVGDWSFRLEAGAPPAEILVAHPREHGALRFLVRGSAPELELVYRDWAKREVVRLEPRPGTPGPRRAKGLVELVPSAAWRRHAFPWRPDEEWLGRVFRLSVRLPADARAPGGGASESGEAAAEPPWLELRYLGPYRPVRKFFRHALMAGEAPATAVAGSVATLPLRLRNTGMRHWAANDVTPVELAYRLEAPGGGSRVGGLTPIPGRVARAQEIDLPVEIRWPRQPGRYRLTVDLILGRTIWFAELGGGPLLEAEVEVTAEADARSG